MFFFLDALEYLEKAWQELVEIKSGMENTLEREQGKYL